MALLLVPFSWRGGQRLCRYGQRQRPAGYGLGRGSRQTDLARRCGLSSYYFIRIFKKVTGQTTHEYLTILRVNKAKELLAFTDNDEHEICAKVGYSELKNMIVNFKRHTGMTPSQFRKQARAEQAKPRH